MADLPTVNAIDDLNETTKVKSDQLQKTVKGGLDINRDALVNLNKSLMKAFSINEELLNLSKAIRAEEYERWLEEQRQQKNLPKPEVKIDKSGFNQSWLLPLLGIGGLASAFVAITASITGLDAALKAVNLPNTFRAIKAPFSAIASFFDSIKKVKIPDVPKVSFVDLEGKPYNFEKFKPKIPDLGIAKFLDDVNVRAYVKYDDTLKAITRSLAAGSDGLKATFMTGGKGGTLFTSIGTALTSVIDEFTKPIRLFTETNPFTERFGKIKEGFENIFNKFPRLDSIELPTWAKNIPQNIGALIGSASEGTGILGFFSKAFSFLDPLLKPLKMVIGTVFRPFTQILLTVVDFVVGFYKGFSGAEGSLMDKLGAGLEGGIRGIIKGITEAIDLIFVQFPAWIMGKLGFEDTANQLKEFSVTALVDPIWDGIKGFFKKIFTGDFMGALGDIGDIYKNLYGYILRQILPTSNPDAKWYDIGNLIGKAIPDSVYEFAGLNRETGERILKPDISMIADGAEVDVRSREIAQQAMQPNITVAAPQTSIQTDNSTSVNKTSVASASPRRDKTPWWTSRNYATN